MSDVYYIFTSFNIPYKVCLIKIKLFCKEEGENLAFWFGILELFRKMQLIISPKDVKTV